MGTLPKMDDIDELKKMWSEFQELANSLMRKSVLKNSD
jgi:hypothetical protein